MHIGRKTNKKMGTALCFVICLVACTSTILLLSLVFALLANSSADPTNKLGLYAFICTVLSAAIGGFVTTKLKNEDALGFSALVALALTLAMLLLCVIINSGKIPASAFMNYGCYLGVFCLSAYITNNQRRRNRRHK